MKRICQKMLKMSMTFLSTLWIAVSSKGIFLSRRYDFFFFFFLLTRYTSDIWSSFIYWSTKSIQYSNRGVFSSCNLFRPRVWFWMPQLEPHSVHLKNSHHYHHFVTNRKQDLFCFKAHHYALTLGVLPDLLLVMLKDIIVVPIHR